MLLLLLACTGESKDNTNSPPFSPGDDTDVTAGPDDTAATGGDSDWSDSPYSELCLHDLPSPIADAEGTFTINGVEDAPPPLPAGVSLDNTGGLEIVGCIPNLRDESPILDDMVFSVWLSLFDHDDAPLDMGIGEDADGVYQVGGGATDWNDVVAWDEGGTFMSFEAGVGSFTTIDKDGGRLVGVVDVTATDPPGYAMQVSIDLTW